MTVVVFDDDLTICPECGAAGDWYVSSHHFTQYPRGVPEDVDLDQYKCDECGEKWVD